MFIGLYVLFGLLTPKSVPIASCKNVARLPNVPSPAVSCIKGFVLLNATCFNIKDIPGPDFKKFPILSTSVPVLAKAKFKPPLTKVPVDGTSSVFKGPKSL